MLSQAAAQKSACEEQWGSGYRGQVQHGQDALDAPAVHHSCSHEAVRGSMPASGQGSSTTGRPAAADRACAAPGLLPGKDLARTQAGRMVQGSCSALAQAERHMPASWLASTNSNPVTSSHQKRRACAYACWQGHPQPAATVFHKGLTAGGRCTRLALSSNTDFLAP